MNLFEHMMMARWNNRAYIVLAGELIKIQIDDRAFTALRAMHGTSVPFNHFFASIGLVRTTANNAYLYSFQNLLQTRHYKYSAQGLIPFELCSASSCPR